MTRGEVSSSEGRVRERADGLAEQDEKVRTWEARAETVRERLAFGVASHSLLVPRLCRHAALYFARPHLERERRPRVAAATAYDSR